MTMHFLRGKIERIMLERDGASPALSSPLEWVLYASSLAYQGAVRLRVRLYHKNVLKQKGLPCKVLSIGNITVGGTGKTPMVEYVANLLQRLGLKVAVISRGYGGNAHRFGGIVSDGTTTFMGRQASGDEPQLLASKLKGIPLLVGRDRYRAGIEAIARFGVSVLVLDDGFQHLALKRDLNLLLVDSTRPFGNGHCIPRGPLREPVDQIKRASALILTRWQGVRYGEAQGAILDTHAPGRPIFRCTHVAERLFVAGEEKAIALATLEGKRLFAFSGIARNDSFRETVASLGGDIVDFIEFSDHHRYAPRHMKSIWERAADHKADSIITTEKDLVNLGADIPSTPKLLVLGIGISFGKDEEAFASYLKSKMMPGPHGG
jgi:tetraacyldisaccharide 4'-kinase